MVPLSCSLRAWIRLLLNSVSRSELSPIALVHVTPPRISCLRSWPCNSVSLSGTIPHQNQNNVPRFQGVQRAGLPIQSTFPRSKSPSVVHLSLCSLLGWMWSQPIILQIIQLVIFCSILAPYHSALDLQSLQYPQYLQHSQHLHDLVHLHGTPVVQVLFWQLELYGLNWISVLDQVSIGGLQYRW